MTLRPSCTVPNPVFCLKQESEIFVSVKMSSLIIYCRREVGSVSYWILPRLSWGYSCVCCRQLCRRRSQDHTPGRKHFRGCLPTFGQEDDRVRPFYARQGGEPAGEDQALCQQVRHQRHGWHQVRSYRYRYPTYLSALFRILREIQRSLFTGSVSESRTLNT